MKTVAGLFDTVEESRRAIAALKEAGFDNSRMSVITQPDEKAGEGEATGQEIAGRVGKAAAGGSVAGGLAGLLAGLGALTIPGLGPVLAAGTLAAALGGAAAGAGIGAAAGGVLGALTSMGLAREEAEVYAEGVKRGGTLVALEVQDGQEDLARTILDQAGAVNTDARRSEWLADGWSHFDETPIPPSHFPGGSSTL